MGHFEQLKRQFSSIMKVYLLAVIVGFASGSYINNDVCKTEYNTVCEEVEKPHVEHKTERKCDTVYNQECRTEYDEVCSSNPRIECNAVQRSVPHTAYERSVEVIYDNQCQTQFESKCSDFTDEVCNVVK